MKRGISTATVVVALVMGIIIGGAAIYFAAPQTIIKTETQTVARTETSTLTITGAAQPPRQATTVTVTQATTVTAPVKLTREEHEKQLVEAARKEGELLVYTSMSPDSSTQALMKAFNEKYTFFGNKATIQRFDGGVLNERFLTEKKAGLKTADVVFTTNNFVWDNFLDGLIEFYISPEQESYPEGWKITGFTTALRPLAVGIGVNTKLVPENLTPKGYRDMLKLAERPEYKGKIVLANPREAGMSRQQLYWLSKMLGADLQGWWQKMKAANAKVEGVTVAREKTALGEYAVTTVHNNNWQFRYEKEGRPMKLVLPEEGVIIVPTPAYLVKGAKNSNSGKLFIDWLLSMEGQKVIEKVNDLPSPRVDYKPPSGMLDLSKQKVHMLTNQFGEEKTAFDQLITVFEKTFLG